MPIAPPRLSFVCELDRARLVDLFGDESVLDDLRALQGRVLMAVSDFSDERAGVVRQLNDAGIPVVGIPLFPESEGYYFTVENAERAEERYEQWKDWSAAHELRWDWVGLDIEPAAKYYEQLMRDLRRLRAMLLPRLRDRERPAQVRAIYTRLVERIHRDGWQVEKYQFPFLADERKTQSDFLQRLLGLVDVPTDREVWMLYNSFLRRLGPGVLWAYGSEAEAIAVGTTGGGPDVEGHPQMPALSWEEFARDLRLARHFTDQIYVHSLEGCVWQGFLPRLRAFEWDEPAAPSVALVAAGMRRVLQAALWSAAHPARATTILIGSALLIRSARGATG